MTKQLTKRPAHVFVQANARGSFRSVFGSAAWLAAGLTAGLLAGCGGGGSTASSVPITVVSNSSDPPPDFVTLPQYKALRETVVTVMGGEVPSASEQTALLAANYATVAEQLSPSLSTPGANAVVVPPLTELLARTLGAAASGETLAQIKSKYDIAPAPYVAALQTHAVTSQLWADQGRRFRTGFLAATDTLGPFARLSGWAGAETGFASGAFATDPAIAASFTALYPWLTVGHLPTPSKEIRLVAVNQVVARADWATLTPFDGVFDRALNPNDLLSMPMLRVNTGVKRFNGSDFTADFLPMANGQHLLSLRPHNGTLASFAAGRLPAALAQAMQGALAVGATPTPGEMVLPQQEIGLIFDAKAPLVAKGVTLPFDEVNANFRNLDGAGGVYAHSVFSTAGLQVGVDGLSMKATDVTAFLFSKKNVFGETFGSAALTVNFGGGNFLTNYVSFKLYTCSWPTPNLRSYYLAVVDAKRWVVSLAAIQAPEGTQVTPGKTAYNPWPNDPRWSINAALQGTIPASTSATSSNLFFLKIATATLQGQPEPAAPPSVPVPTYWDVVAEAAQYGFVLSDGVYTHASCVDK